jgi:hypothetical protein
MSAYADTSALRRLPVQDESCGLLENYLREQDGLATCDLTVTELPVSGLTEQGRCCSVARSRWTPLSQQMPQTRIVVIG